MILTIKNESWGKMFGVPAALVDQYLKLATPTQLKVILYLLRHNATETDTATIAQALGLSPEMVEEALLFWQQSDLFSAPAPPPPPVPKIVPATQTRSSDMLPAQISACIDASDDLQNLFHMAEPLLHRPINHKEQCSLVWLHDYLGFQSDVILTALGFACGIEHFSIMYVEEILKRWYSEGIFTLQQAQIELAIMEERHTYNNKIMRLMEMHRKPTPKQQAAIDSWKEINIPMDLIRYAYEKCVENLDRLSFSYIDKILKFWSKGNAKNREDADRLDALYFQQKQQQAAASGSGSSGGKKKKEIPVSPKSDLYQSLIDI